LIFQSYVYHPGKNELLAEKIRAFLTRNKGRDIYDIWYLLSQKGRIEDKLVSEKIKYYGINSFAKKDVLRKINAINKKDFIRDLRPFVSLNERDKLGDFFDYLKDYLGKFL